MKASVLLSRSPSNWFRFASAASQTQKTQESSLEVRGAKRCRCRSGRPAFDATFLASASVLDPEELPLGARRPAQPFS